MKIPFPWIALGVGLLIALLLLMTGAIQSTGGYQMPLLTQLIAAEFGFFLTAVGAGLAVRDMRAQGVSPTMLIATAGCVLLSAGFLWLGIQLWPQGGLQ